jgi:hypothetical protein
MRFRTAGSAFAIAALLTGCVNLEAVRSYTDAAAPVVGNTQPAARWKDSEKQLRSFRIDGDKCPLERTDRFPQEEFDKTFKELSAIHNALAEYFSAIGALAADELPQTQKTAATSLDGISKAGLPITDAQKSAVLSLFKVLDRGFNAYRHLKLRQLMKESDKDISTILVLLQKLSDVYAAEGASEKIQVINFVQCSIGQKDLIDPYVGRRELERINDYYDAEKEKLTLYKTALVKISADHAAIKNALALEDRKLVEKTVREIASSAEELRAAQQAISAL